VAAQLDLALSNADRLPTLAEQEQQKRAHESRLRELTAQMQEQEVMAHQQLQAQAEELVREARVRAARMRELQL
jgi:uncharacterized membrane protein